MSNYDLLFIIGSMFFWPGVFFGVVAFITDLWYGTLTEGFNPYWLFAGVLLSMAFVVQGINWVMEVL